MAAYHDSRIAEGARRFDGSSKLCSLAICRKFLNVGFEIDGEADDGIAIKIVSKEGLGRLRIVGETLGLRRLNVGNASQFGDRF